MLWLAEDDSTDAEGAASRGEQGATGCLPSPAPPTTWCACGTWPSQFRRCKSGPTCVSSSIELEAEATKTPGIKPFDIINNEQPKEKHAANQFFSSLLGKSWLFSFITSSMAEDCTKGCRSLRGKCFKWSSAVRNHVGWYTARCYICFGIEIVRSGVCAEEHIHWRGIKSSLS